MRRFLFLFSDTGGGHRASAQAVRDELVRLYGSAAQVEMVDVLVDIGRWPFYHFPRWYPQMFRLRGIPWRMGYWISDNRRLVEIASQLTWPYTGRGVMQSLRRHPADLIVSFHGLPNAALALALRRLRWNIPFAIVVLDLVSVHAGWFTRGAQTYLVPTEEARQRALRCQLAPEQVQVAGGMPVRRSFVEAAGLTQAEARVRLGLPATGPVVLLVGGGDGMGPLEPVVQALAARAPQATLVAVAGRNQPLYERLVQLQTPVPVRVEGFLSNMEVWMRAADLLVTKAGPNTITEGLVSGLPMVLYSALPGQEEGNITYVVEHGVGLWAPQPERAAAAVMALLQDPARREAMAVQARALACPQSTERIARRLWALT